MKTQDNITALSSTLRLTRVAILCLSIFAVSCEDFIQIEPPRTDLIKSTVFASDATADAAMRDVYYQLRSSGFASATISSISFYGALSSDELLNNYGPTAQMRSELKQVNDNAILPNNTTMNVLWSQLYKCIFKTNSILEGIAGSTGLTEKARKQLTGEAKFVRAFCYFYLANLFGDVPLVLTTDYRVNSNVPREPVAAVYQQIIADLLEAKTLLPVDYSDYSNLRVRANASAASALLARTYLFTEDWAAAEFEASLVINSSTLYTLAALPDVFRSNGTEPIFQLWSNTYPNDLPTFSDPGKCELTAGFMASFEPGDQRRSRWIFDYPVGGRIVPLPYKYRVLGAPTSEYSTVMRLAEQYLIRAEARAQQDDVSNGLSDLNTLRTRAGLSPSAAADKPELLAVIEQERKIELFAEWGHRWFDLKRTGRADAILSPVKPQWTTTAVLFPLPESEIRNNASLANAQNPGY